MIRSICIERLRPSANEPRAVDRDGPRYKRLKNAIRRHGLIVPITVRKTKDGEYGIPYYEIIDGLHRFAVYRELRLGTILCNVVSEEEMLIAQQRTASAKFQASVKDWKESFETDQQRLGAPYPKTMEKAATRTGSKEIHKIPPTGYELLYGKPEEPKIKTTKIEYTVKITEAEPLVRKGWDHVHGQGYGASFAYCSGPWLVRFTGRVWKINHPEKMRLETMNFSCPTEAMVFIEENFHAHS